MQRKVFGQSILDHETVHYRLAELETEIELLRSLLYRASSKSSTSDSLLLPTHCTVTHTVAINVEMFVDGHNVTKMASMVKLKAGRLARELPDACLQYWGGMGFTSDVLVSRFFR